MEALNPDSLTSRRVTASPRASVPPCAKREWTGTQLVEP